MNSDVQKAVRGYRSAVGTLEVSQAEEQLWLAMSRWRDAEVDRALRRVEQMARSLSAGDVADEIREMIDQRESFEGTFDVER